MRNTLRNISFLLALIFAPIFWLAFNITGDHFTLKWMYKDLIEFYKSGDDFSVWGF